MNSGYIGYSKSVRAAAAERDDAMTASVLAQALGVDMRAVVDHCHRAEWHHTSAWFNSTNYYFEPGLLVAAGAITEAMAIEQYDAMPEDFEAAKALLRNMRDDTKARRKATAITLDGITVEWLEWSGSRKHAKCTERSAKDCRVRYAPGRAMCDIVLPDGQTMRKKIGTRGLLFNGRAVLES